MRSNLSKFFYFCSGLKFLQLITDCLSWNVGFLKIAVTSVTDISCVVLSNFVNNTCQIQSVFVKLKFHHTAGIKTPIANYKNKFWPSFGKMQKFINSSLGIVQTYLLFLSVIFTIASNSFFVTILVIFLRLPNTLFIMKIVLTKPSLIFLRRFC